MGYVALFNSPLGEEAIRGIVEVWLESCERVEQVVPNQIATTRLEKTGDIMWGRHMQFRLLNGDQFAWAYLTANSRSIETTGMPNGDKPSLCLTVLTELPDVVRVIEDTNHDELDALEEEGLL
jgi:hypothetical protein